MLYLDLWHELCFHQELCDWTFVTTSRHGLLPSLARFRRPHVSGTGRPGFLWKDRPAGTFRGSFAAGLPPSGSFEFPPGPWTGVVHGLRAPPPFPCLARPIRVGRHTLRQGRWPGWRRDYSTVLLLLLGPLDARGRSRAATQALEASTWILRRDVFRFFPGFPCVSGT